MKLVRGYQATRSGDDSERLYACIGSRVFATGWIKKSVRFCTHDFEEVHLLPPEAEFIGEYPMPESIKKLITE